VNSYIEEQLALQRQQQLARTAHHQADAAASLPGRAPHEAGRARLGSTTPLARLTRLTLWCIGLNALAGAVSLLLFPGYTEQLFFWAIAPPLNAALLGALYLAGGIAVCDLARRGRWEPARVVFPVLITAGLLIAGVTLAHHERFTPGLGLGYWLLVYVGAAVLAAALVVVQERRGARWAVATMLAPAARWLAAVSGACVLVGGVLLLIWPAAAVAAWPWPTTPLITRIFAAWFSAFGVGLLWFLVDDDWERLALLPRLLVAAAGLDLAVLLIHRDDVTTTGPGLWLYVLHLLGLMLIGGLLPWLQRGQHRPTPLASPGTGA
jgi:hypothetical protein